MPTKCPICKNEFEGRASQKFCSARCRSLYNTRLYVKRNAPLFEQEKIRRKNAAALQAIFKVLGNQPFKQDTLKRVGFDFQVSTFAPVGQFGLAFGGYVLHAIDAEFFAITKTN